MYEYEQLGLFYLGRLVDPATGQLADTPLLYDSADLTTHAVIVGMTGSGKTGLGVVLIEEAAIDGVPALVLDPKGDLANLLLQFPQMEPGDVRPWVDPSEAAREGLDPEAMAARIAADWRRGLEEWGQPLERIARLRAAADFSVYTPGSTAGRPLALLRSLEPPSGGAGDDPSRLRDRVAATAASLLSWAGVDSDPVRSREHILVAALIADAWQRGRAVDLPSLIGAIQKPPFDRIGVFDLETFFPARARLELAMRLNHLLAAPGFAAWLEGDPLDVGRLLHSRDGRPRVSVVSLAHLADEERMMVVTLLLGEVVAWMRTQPGTSALRAVLYMDEIFGFFPPTAAPPSKAPMLTLLKQARAAGLGVVLATQNPVDLDYKGLGNTGTWMIGRLQTDRDKARVLEGLASAAGDVPTDQLDRLISNLGKRTFVMRNVHETAPVLFRTRWTLSLLRGPLTLAQIRSLAPATTAPEPTVSAPAVPLLSAVPTATVPPLVPPDLPEIEWPAPVTPSGPRVARPFVLGRARLHFVDPSADVDTWVSWAELAPISGGDGLPDWSAGRRLDEVPPLSAPSAELVRSAPWSGMLPARSAQLWTKSFTVHLQQSAVLQLYRCLPLRMTSRPGEPEGEFRVRVGLALRERRDERVAEIRRRYAERLAALEQRIAAADQRVERERAQYRYQTMNATIAFGSVLLGALLGRKALGVGTVGRAATAMRSAGRIGRERGDVARAGEIAAQLRERLAALQQELQAELDRVAAECSPAAAPVEPFEIRPRKSDVVIELVALAWVPTTAGR
ncbi:MAG: DUF87 domain-containing protein [Kiritimatiellae bacterium]|nr:DUF87 domain-containing protein [Kiritimatiellia bacterium]